MDLPAEQVEQLLADYDRALAGSLLAAHSRRAYRSRVAGYLAWLATTDYPGDPLADPHTRNHAARDYRTWLTTRQRRRPATANAALTALDHFYSHLGLGPAAAKRADLPAAAPRALSEDEQRDFLRAVEKAASPRDRAIAMVFFYTGVRVAELAALDLADIELTARKGRLVVRAGKGGSYREIPLHKAARAALRAWLKARRAWPGAEDTDALFLNRRGRRISTRSLDALVTGFGRAARITREPGDPPVTPHVLRHSFGTRLLRKGTDVVLVAELMGHRRLDTTRRYTLPTAADRERAIDLLLTDE